MTAADAWDEKTRLDGPDFEPIVPIVKPKRRRGLRYALAAVILVGGAGAGAWYLWGDTLFLDPDAEIPLVRAEGIPIKVRPENPGGMDVPDRDKLVYDRMEGTGERPTVERLLPPPEMPKPLPIPSAESQPVTPPTTGGETPAPAAQVAPQTPAATVPEKPAEAAPPPPVPPSAEPGPTVAEVLSTMRPPPPPEGKEDEVAPTLQKPAQPSAPEAAPKAAAPAESKPEPEPQPMETASAPEATPPPVVESLVGGYKVQLAAVREPEAVDGEWKRLQKKNSDLLGDLKLSVQKADLGPGKGVFFRLRAGPLSDEAAARALCDKLKARKVGCLIVRPKG